MTRGPTILAFDTSGSFCAVSLRIDGKIVSQQFEEMGRGQAERLMPMIQDVMDANGAVYEELDAIGVGVGPGNFTGIRIAVAAARGLTLSLGVPAIGVTGFETLHWLADCPHERSLVVLPAPQGKTYAQVFDAGRAQGDPLCRDFEVDGVHDLGLLSLVIGPETEESFAFRVSYELSPSGVPIDAPDARPTPMGQRQAEAVAALTTSKLQTETVRSAPAPLYIRDADAAPSRIQPPKILT